MPLWGLDWGNVPGWVATIGGVTTVAVTLRSRKKGYREQAELVMVARSSGSRKRLTIENGSEQPLRNVFAYALRRGRDGSTYHSLRGREGPGSVVVSWFKVSGSAASRRVFKPGDAGEVTLPDVVNPETYAVYVVWTDARGIAWTKMPYGKPSRPHLGRPSARFVANITDPDVTDNGKGLGWRKRRTGVYFEPQDYGGDDPDVQASSSS